MSRRDFLRALDRFGQLHAMEFQRGPKQYSRCVRQFSSTNEHNQGNKEGKCGDACTREEKQREQQEQENYHHHGRNTRRELQRQREADFVREFNDIHNHFFGNLPLRRYVHFDNYSTLDRIFNQEFNRIRKDLFEKENAEEKNNHQETAKESNQSTKQTSQTSGTAAANGADKKAFEAQNQGKQSESSSQDLQRQHHHHHHDHFLDLNSFFESPRYISDVGNIFRREEQRLQELTKEFESSFRNQENNPGARTIRRVYRSNPEGEVREFYDSKNPEQNYRFERKFDKSTGQSTISRTRGDQLLGREQQQQQQNAGEQHNAAATKTASETTVNHHKSNENNHKHTEKKTAQTESASPAQQPQQQAPKAETTSGTIAIPPELNDKAKKLSIMLKKDYLECLELAKVYQTKSVGQIIDLVIESENAK